jgi:phage host-nuclease inhibitor protein Gam
MGKRSIPVIENVLQAEEVMVEIKEIQNQTVAKHAAHLKEIHALEERLRGKKVAHKTMLQEQQGKVRDLILGLFRFAKMHRHELTNGGKQIRFPMGSIAQWRATTSILITDVKSAEKYVLENNLNDFFKLKVTFKKREMNNQWPKAKDIPGVIKNEEENFLVRPVGVEKPISHRVKYLDHQLSVDTSGEMPKSPVRELVPA